MAHDNGAYDTAPTMVPGCSCHENGVVTENVRLGNIACETDARDGLGSCPCRCHLPEPAGYPCRYCGEPIPDDGSEHPACPKCWAPATAEHLDSLYLEAWLGHEHVNPEETT